MSTNYVVSSLPSYVKENQDVLVKNFALMGGDTRSRMSKQTGIKYKEYLNYFEVAPTLQDGTGCGFNPLGDATLTQREIECPSIKIDMDICERSLLGKYKEYLVRNNANEHALPFEKELTDSLVAEVVKKIENLIWRGDKTQTTNTNLKWFNGLLKIANTESSVIDVTLGGTSVFDDVDLMIASIPEEVLEKGAEVYMSPSKFNTYLKEVRNKNYFHYSGAVDETPNEFIHPGSGVKVVKTPGLASSTNMLATYPGNLVYGCDMEGDNESLDIWFSNDDRVWKVQILWNCGVQIAFPNLVVLGA